MRFPISKLHVQSANNTIKALKSIGFQVVSQKGSHIKMKGKNGKETFIVIIPNYNEIPIGTLKSIIRQAGLSPDDFMKLI